MLNRATLPQEVAKLAKNLPPFPAIVVQLLDMLRDESATFEVLARMARNDPVISANILAQTADVPSIPWSGGGIKSGLNSEGVIPKVHETQPRCSLIVLAFLF